MNKESEDRFRLNLAIFWEGKLGQMPFHLCAQTSLYKTCRDDIVQATFSFAETFVYIKNFSPWGSPLLIDFQQHPQWNEVCMIISILQMRKLETESLRGQDFA